MSGLERSSLNFPCLPRGLKSHSLLFHISGLQLSSLSLPGELLERIPASFTLRKDVLSQINDRYISVVTAFGKKVGNSLVTLCFGHQIIKND